MSNKKLFDNDSSEEEEDNKKLAVNKSYAENYEKWRRKEDYQKLKDKYGEEALNSDSESDSSTDAELAEPDNPDFDMDFFRVLAAIKLKHPVLNEDRKFFKESYVSKSKKDEGKDGEGQMTIRDYQRKILLERGGKYEDEDEEPQPGLSWRGKSNFETEEELSEKKKEKFTFQDDLSDDDEGDDSIFTRRQKITHQEKQQQKQEERNKPETKQNEAISFLKGETTSLKDKTDEELLLGLKEQWTQGNMSAKDKYLMDYFVNQRYLEEEDETVQRAPNHYVLDVEPLEDDEETYGKMEEYESKYRFRFEEPDEDFIRSHPRMISDTMRKADAKRKEMREKKKRRVEEEEERREQEIMRMRAWRKKEILERIEMLEDVAGVAEGRRNHFQDFDLEADFDPSEHDRVMSRLFDTEYYDEAKDETEKPVVQDQDLNRELQEEYDKLDELEAMTTKTGTYRYTEVIPNNYGLSTEEILCAKDTELNRWFSMKKMLCFDQDEATELKYRKNYEHRASLGHSKRKIMPSLFTDNIEEQWDIEEARKRRRNLKKKERKLKKQKMEEGDIAITTETNLSKEKHGKEKKKKKKKKKKNEKKIEDGVEVEENCEQNEEYKEETNVQLKQNKNSVSNPSLTKKKKKKNKTKIEDSVEVEENEEENQEETNVQIKQDKNSGNNSSLIKKKKKKKKNKTKIEDSVEENYEQNEDRVEENQEEPNVVQTKQHKKNVNNSSLTKKKKKTKQLLAENESLESKTKSETQTTKKKKRKRENTEEETEAPSKKKKKMKKNKEENKAADKLQGISDARLRAYGENPKALKRMLKYSNKKII